jgi:hypothetical protein
MWWGQSLGTSAENVANYHIDCVGSEVLTAVVMKSYIFWDITPCSPLKVNLRFVEECRLHLHGRRVNQAINQNEKQRARLSWHSNSKKTILHTLSFLHNDSQLMTETCSSHVTTYRLIKFVGWYILFIYCWELVVQTGSGAQKPPIQWVPGVKRPGREADHSLPASAEVKKMWNYTSIPLYVFMV